MGDLEEPDSRVAGIFALTLWQAFVEHGFGFADPGANMAGERPRFLGLSAEVLSGRGHRYPASKTISDIQQA